MNQKLHTQSVRPWRELVRHRRGLTRNSHPVLLMVALVLLSAQLMLGMSESAAQSTQPGSNIRVPNFWDPNRRYEKPDIKQLPAIRFVSTKDFPPFNFRDPEGRYTGFHIDMARELCAILNHPCSIQWRPFDQLITAVREEQADAIIAGLTISAEHRRELQFSDVYLRLPGRFAGRHDAAPFAPDDPRSPVVAVVAGSAHERFLLDSFPKLKLQPTLTMDAATKAVRDGTAEFVFADGLALSFWLSGATSANCCRYFGGPYLDSGYFGHGFAIAVKKGNADLESALNYALAELHKQGKYAEIYLRYFPYSFF